MLQNNFLSNVAQWRLTTAVGVKLVTNNEVVHLAKGAGYDCLFIDLEHSTLSLLDASRLCSAGLMAQITPFVRVPWQCGNGFVGRVLDGGACGIVFPHISTVEDARDAVSACKFPPLGKRSLTAALPHFNFQRTSPAEVTQTINNVGSTVIVMIETPQALDNIDAIAAVEGVDILLLGANDLSLEVGIPGDWDHAEFRNALTKIAAACQDHAKCFGIAGIYTRPAVCQWAVQELGARFVLGHLDIGLLAMAMNRNAEMLRDLEK
ncbi:hypothetical protein M409DRAFT_24292 [Zasmidium cellare ATCC 36951]|uniref:HpcH/HpaI aldolase/citrate lyase domain-containing protein n=1 Tax=Zasmidium cellare ATCC 36951 TaxID=1080233 RepID=A0A6A6CFL9_ZASCE|nr:uncharacterized protein M409DRAFT_24292 [Zasmidium cellare ATCC 36951]KAF2165443.1 hypothetical protein M409DRAFT_24292 [Zasmidium cellare ATCC 36951]